VSQATSSAFIGSCDWMVGSVEAHFGQSAFKVILAGGILLWIAGQAFFFLSFSFSSISVSTNYHVVDLIMLDRFPDLVHVD
jgi:hypothetical protein